MGRFCGAARARGREWPGYGEALGRSGRPRAGPARPGAPGHVLPFSPLMSSLFPHHPLRSGHVLPFTPPSPPLTALLTQPEPSALASPTRCSLYSNQLQQQRGRKTARSSDGLRLAMVYASSCSAGLALGRARGRMVPVARVPIACVHVLRSLHPLLEHALLACAPRLLGAKAARGRKQ